MPSLRQEKQRDSKGRLLPGHNLNKTNPQPRKRDKALALRDMLLKELVENGKAMEALQKCIHKQPAAVLNLVSKLLPTNVEHTHRVLPAPVIVEGAGVVTSETIVSEPQTANLTHDEGFVG